LTELIITLALILLGGVFAGAEIAVVALRSTRLRELVEERRPGARSTLVLREHPERFLATVQVGITVVGTAASAFGGYAIAQRLTPAVSRLTGLTDHAHDLALALVVTLISYLSIVLGELVPKSLALRHAETYALWIGKPLLGLSWIARPVVWLLSASANLLLRPFGDATTFTETRHSIEELQQLVEEAAKAGTLHPQASEIATRALELPELRVSDVMVPRHQAVLLPRDITVEQLEAVVREHPHTRLPVYDGQIDNVVGYVSMKDVLRSTLGRQPLEIGQLLRPSYFVPESKRALELLQDMRERRMKFAIVVDELGGLAGVVTFEDLVEELVGEVFSEHSQPPPPPIREQADGSVLVNAALPIRELNRVLGVELPEDGKWHTLAGLTLAVAGRVPTPGESFTLDSGIRLEMVDVSPRRVRSVRLHRPQAEPPSEVS
jgi:putative hemolysin